MDIISNFWHLQQYLLGSTKNKITEDRNGENVSHLQIVEIVLIHCNIADNNYHQNFRILYSKQTIC